MEEITKEEIENYIESELDSSIISCKSETTIEDIGYEITIWNVKTNDKGSWWVASGGGLPMNLYPQDKPYYFGTDEVFSFHIGLMKRFVDGSKDESVHVIDFIAGKTEIADELWRMLLLTSKKADEASEIEEIQSIGVICRETLLKFIEIVSQFDDIIINYCNFKKADFKNRIELIIKTVSPGKTNRLMRKQMKNLAFNVWDYSNELTHSSTKTTHDAKICFTLCVSFITSMEHLFLKYYDILSDEKCKKCGSKRLFIAENDENDVILIVCEKCNYGYPISYN